MSIILPEVTAGPMPLNLKAEKVVELCKGFLSAGFASSFFCARLVKVRQTRRLSVVVNFMK